MAYGNTLERYQDILKMYKKRWTAKEIGEKYNITHQRVFQILKNGLPKESKRFPNPLLKGVTGRDFTRQKVRIRDKFTCQKCGKIWEEGQRKFDVHHLDGLCGKMTKKYDKPTSLEKLITLCHKCHLTLDSVVIKRNEGIKKYQKGRKNFERLAS